MSATSTPQFYITAFPTTSPTYSPTQNATLPIVVVDVQGTNMTTTNALLGSTLALIIVAVALAAGRYLPAGWTQRFRRMIPQSTIDNFKRDPLGSVTAMVNDPKSILKNINIKIPDSVKDLADFAPKSIKDAIGVTSTEAGDEEEVGKETLPSPDRVEHASSRKVAIEMPTRHAPSPLPVIQEEELLPEPEPEPEPERVSAPPVRERAPSPPPMEPEHKEVVNIDGGVIVPKDETKIQIPTTIEIKPEDLEEIKAFMESRNVQHVIR